MINFIITKFENRMPCNISKATNILIFITATTFLWYSISVTFTIFNKYFLTAWTGVGFHYPILGVTIHMFIKLILSRIWYRYSDDVIHPLSSELTLKVVIPIGIATALDIMCSNQAILYISVSMYTIIKSSLVIFTFGFGVYFNIDTFYWSLFFSILVIVGGLGLAIWSEILSDHHVSLMGIVYVLIASAMGGLRWTLTQVLIREDHFSSDTMVVIYRIAPAAAYCMVPFAIFVDLPQLLTESNVFIGNIGLLAEAISLLVCGGAIAFALIFVEIALLQLTSSLSMGVLGQTKEILQICVAMIVLHEHLAVRSVIGVIISICGLFYYKKTRYGLSDTSQHGLHAHGGLTFYEDEDLGRNNKSKTKTFYEVGKSMFNRYRSNSNRPSDSGTNMSLGLGLNLGSASKTKSTNYFGREEEDVMLIQIDSGSNAHDGARATQRNISYEPLGQVSKCNDIIYVFILW